MSIHLKFGLKPSACLALRTSFSLLPISYPGHNLLTEDLGTIHGLDGCTCGRRGKYFSVEGRVEGTQLRGCSDVGS